MKISIPIEVKFDDIKNLIDDLDHLQTYKLSEDDEMTLVDAADVADILAKHVKAEERKTGRWVSDVAYYDEEGCPCIVSRCNQCGEANPKTNYCPNCGARMGVEHDG